MDSKGAFSESKLELGSSQTHGDLRLQVTRNKIIKTGSRQSKKKKCAFSGLDSALDTEMIKIPKAGLPQFKRLLKAHLNRLT